METKTCIHPIKANRIIAEFINNAFTYNSNIIINPARNDIIDYGVSGTIEDKRIVFFVPNWRKANYKNDQGGKLFRKDFEKRCQIGKGFADITISILHEMGHTVTQKDLPEDYNRFIALKRVYQEGITDTEKNSRYFSMLDETFATNWAIKWLQNPENRKIAKTFEKKFFACFEK